MRSEEVQSPSVNMGRQDELEGDGVKSTSPPTVKTLDSPRISYADDSEGDREGDNDQQEELYSPRWSDYNEDDDDIGHVPTFGNPGSYLNPEDYPS